MLYLVGDSNTAKSFVLIDAKNTQDTGMIMDIAKEISATYIKILYKSKCFLFILPPKSQSNHDVLRD